MKECKKCNELKKLDEFYKKSNSCKKCDIEKVKKYISNNREDISIKRKNRYQKNREVELLKKKAYDEKNRELIREKARNFYDPEKAKKYYLENKDDILSRNKDWSDKNKDYHRELNRKNVKKWMKENPHIVVWRQILYRTIRSFNLKKTSTTIEMIGYSADDLKLHIESLFEDGMSWSNWGEWHIDHIKPLCTFSSDTPVSIVNSLENLRPLWAEDNLKRKKYQNL
jgi:hypothetical protein